MEFSDPGAVINRPVSQMRAPLAACREPAESYDKATRNSICFWT